MQNIEAVVNQITEPVTWYELSVWVEDHYGMVLTYRQMSEMRQLIWDHLSDDMKVS